MTDNEPKVLVPIRILEGQTIPEGIIDLLATVPVVLLGYHVLPEQTPPGQAQMQFEDKAQAKLDDLVTMFEERGKTVETRLVFTHDREQTFNRVANEEDCAAILISNPVRDIERVLVPVRGEANVERIAGFVADLLRDTGVEVALYNVVEDEERQEEGHQMVNEAAKILIDGGIDEDRVLREVVVTDTPIKSIVNTASEYDAVIMGESEPSIRSLIFGEASEQVAEQTLGPVIVVRRGPKPDTEDPDSEPD